MGNERSCCNWLKMGHGISKCNSSYKCFKCGGCHNISICETDFKKCDKRDDDKKINSERKQ